MTKHWSKPSGTTIFYCAWNTSLSELNWGAKNLLNQIGYMSFFLYVLIFLICIPFCKVNCICRMCFLASIILNTIRSLWLSNDYVLPKTVKMFWVWFFGVGFFVVLFFFSLCLWDWVKCVVYFKGPGLQGKIKVKSTSELKLCWCVWPLGPELAIFTLLI